MSKRCADARVTLLPVASQAGVITTFDSATATSLFHLIREAGGAMRITFMIISLPQTTLVELRPQQGLVPELQRASGTTGEGYSHANGVSDECGRLLSTATDGPPLLSWCRSREGSKSHCAELPRLWRFPLAWVSAVVGLVGEPPHRRITPIALGSLEWLRAYVGDGRTVEQPCDHYHSRRSFQLPTWPWL